MNQTDIVQKLRQSSRLIDECIRGLDAETSASGARRAASTRAHAKPTRLDFEANERAFVKAHSHGLSGPRKFTLLLAYLVKGEIGKGVGLKDIEKRWNRMKSPRLLGGKFNRFYSSAAKENGWVDAEKGTYVLTRGWEAALQRRNE